MKKILLSAALILTTIFAFSQSFDNRKKISVSGMAEQEITPDEIYIAISLREYINTFKKRVTIESLEEQLQKAVIKAGIANQDFMINNISAYNNYWEKKKDPTFLASKQYTIKVNNLNKLNDILSAVDPKGIAYTNVERYSYSKEDDLKKELKVRALKQAKDKATYLLEAIGERVGGAIEISDNENVYYPPMMYRNKDAMMVENQAAAMPEIDFKKIKITAQVNAVFEIK